MNYCDFLCRKGTTKRLPKSGDFESLAFRQDAWDKWISKTRNMSKVRGLTHIHICCRVKHWSKIWFFCVKHWSKSCVKMVQAVFLFLFPQFLACLKTEIVSICAKIVFSQIVGMSKMRFSKRKLHFLVCLFL